MSDDVQQTNWLFSIIIAFVLAVPGWYLYYDASSKSDLDEKKNVYKIQRLEKQLEIVRDNAASDYANWRRRFQDANQALIAANTKLKNIKTKLEKVKSGAIVDSKSNDFQVVQTDLMKQLEISNQSNTELMAKLNDQSSMVESLTQELAKVKNKYAKAQTELKAMQLAGQSNQPQNIKKADAEIVQIVTKKHQVTKKQLSAEHAQLKQSVEQLKDVLAQAIQKKEVEILAMPDDSTVIRMQSNVLFDSASALLKDEAKPALDQIATALQNLSYRKVSIEGHTDALQIVGKGEWHFVSNWELSAARAAAAARYLLYSNKELDATKVQIVGHGAYSPVADNATPEGRQLNRRIEIRIISNDQEDETQ